MSEEQEQPRTPMNELLERAKEIIGWFPREACPDCNGKEHDNPNCRIHAWLADFAAHKPEGPFRLRSRKMNGAWEWIIESIDGWDTRELALADARCFAAKIGIEVENG